MGHTARRVVKAPDGGWGWVVCGASFACLGIMQGFVFLLGLIHADLLDYYRASSSLTAAVSSVHTGVPMLVGPLVGALVRCVGIRPTTCFGGLVFGMAVAVSVMSPNVVVMIFVFGVVGGAAAGMVFLPAQLAIGMYFDKKKGLAYGISNCGAGIGGTVFPLLYNALEDKYTWKGALVIMGGIILNCAVFGSLFRPLKKPKRQSFRYTITSYGNRSRTQVQAVATILQERQPTQTQQQQLQSQQQHQQQQPQKEASNVENNSVDPRFPVLNGLHSDRQATRAVASRRASRRRTSSVHIQLNTYDTMKAPSVLRKTIDQLGVDLLMNPTFLAVLFVMVFSVSFATLLVLLPHYSTLVGLSDSQVSLMMTVIGVTNVLSPLAFGLVADKWLPVIWVYMYALIIGSLSAALMPYTTDFGHLMAESVVFGTAFGSCLSLRQVVLLEHFGQRELPKALGLTTMFQGIVYLIAPPIAGRLYEYTGSYREPFLLVGVAFALAALMCIPIGCLGKRQKELTVTCDKDKLSESGVIYSTRL